MSESLHSLIEPYFLRRTKKEVFPNQDGKSAVPETSESSEAPTKQLSLPVRKNDFIIWLPITSQQHKLYLSFLDTEEVRNVLNKTSSPLAAISVLKKITDHPLLLHNEMKTCQSLDLSQ